MLAESYAIACDPTRKPLQGSWQKLELGLGLGKGFGVMSPYNLS